MICCRLVVELETLSSLFWLRFLMFLFMPVIFHLMQLLSLRIMSFTIFQPSGYVLFRDYALGDFAQVSLLRVLQLVC
ncbi:hypothetical protein BHE74_00010287 [Ensete ventricosum]|uniref:Uncharacterized protein n=1 Tax=Ensete ventricosum TaxID=4639 RepID=A0A444FZI5_ENSVE|nr:hypothetical protein B296_00008510 [Ensete ventricosum]RWW28028.1 hypothetical protein GW17_00007520 [Ensete ventricosum]RWW81335.1 hypothetical protein BHE74_00010287 [Ensete ventricosum]RZR82394.1 hypothetical protein BHM03_00008809 [Ensete ventricosum]